MTSEDDDRPANEHEPTDDDPPAESGGDREGPLADLAERVESRQSTQETGLFESVDVDSIDGEELLNNVTDSQRGFDDASDGTEPIGEELSERNLDASEDVLDKRTYCQQCPYLSEPPNLRCEHDGTAILEVIDSDRFRVRGCPMVTAEGPRFKFERL